MPLIAALGGTPGRRRETPGSAWAAVRPAGSAPGPPPPCPAIALTAFARAEDRARALDSGYQMHIAKPVAPAALVAAIANLAASAATALE